MPANTLKGENSNAKDNIGSQFMVLSHGFGIKRLAD
jgi:hypothetical protein